MKYNKNRDIEENGDPSTALITLRHHNATQLTQPAFPTYSVITLLNI